MREWAEVVEKTGGSIAHARPIEAVRVDPDVADALAHGAILTTVAMVRHAEAKRLGLTRSAMVETLTKRLAAGAI